MGGTHVWRVEPSRVGFVSWYERPQEPPGLFWQVRIW